MRFRPPALSILIVLALGSLFSFPVLADSGARIVRLSTVDGDVMIDRHLGRGFEKAFLNLPITEGTQLKTVDGRAEVELENGSTVRIVPNTLISFKELDAHDSGAKVSAIEILRGTAYMNVEGPKDDEFILSFAREQISLKQAAHLRVQVGDNDAAVAVFKGDVLVSGASGEVTVAKKQTVSFDLDDSDRYKLAKNLQQDPFDGWDKAQDQYHQRYMASTYSTYSPYAYGTTDLNYYGNFFNAPGYGTVWQPYFAGAGWDPFLNGAWAFSGGGYGWVSGYPWGWTPYHYGAWAFAPGFGWVWQPGGTWYGYSGPLRVLNAPRNYVVPSAPVGVAKGSVVVVNRGPQVIAKGSSNKLVIHNNSAGLGIPRGGIGNMSRASDAAAQRGSITASVRTAPVIYPSSSEARPQSSTGTISRGNSIPATVSPSSAHASSGVHIGHR